LSAGSSHITDPVCERCGRDRAGDPPRCPSCGSLERAALCLSHRDRLTTSACVVCGTPLCGDCRRGPRHASLCSRHEDVPLIEGWAEALRTADEIEARLVSDGLSGEGIEARVLSQKDRTNVVTFGGLSILRVLVPAYRFEEAREWIEYEEPRDRNERDGG
jgi:hypothetical protein